MGINGGNETTASLTDAAPYHNAGSDTQGIGRVAESRPTATTTRRDGSKLLLQRNLKGPLDFLRGGVLKRCRYILNHILNRRHLELRHLEPDVCRGSKRQSHQSRADRFDAVYLRAAQAYMLISMPTGTSTIFGVFQVIRDPPN